MVNNNSNKLLVKAKDILLESITELNSLFNNFKLENKISNNKIYNTMFFIAVVLTLIIFSPLILLVFIYISSRYLGEVVRDLVDYLENL